MAKSGGLGDQLYVAGYDLSGDVGAIQSLHGGPAPLVVTGINASAPERLGGRRDGGIEFNSFLNDAALHEHVALSPLPTADVHLLYCRGTTLGNPGAGMVAKQVNYDWSLGADGALLGSVQALANGYGLEMGRLLTAGKRTDTVATNGSSIDDAASSAFGLQMYWQLFSFAGTSVTIKIQESSDNGGGDAFADVVGATSGALTALGAGRAATASGLSVERYLRCVTTGTFSSAVFAVLVVRNATEVVF